MPSVLVPNTIQCDVVFLLWDQRVENVFYVEVPGGVDAPTIQDTANQVGNWVEDSYLPFLSASLTFLNVEAKNLSIADGGVAIYNAAPGTVGGIASPGEPGNVSYCVSLRTASSGRSFRGRKYVPGIPTNKHTGNVVESTWSGDIVNALNQLITVLAGFDKVLVIVSRIADGVDRITGLSTPVISASVTDMFLDSQRRRLTGRGT